MNTVLALALLSTSALAAEPVDPQAQITAACDDVLAILTEQQREIAKQFAAIGGTPVIDTNNPRSFAKGRIGALEAYYYAGEIREGNPIAGTKSGTPAFKIDEVVNPTTVIIGGHRIWVEGVDASGVVNGEVMNFNGLVFEVLPSKQYATALGGTNTIRCVRLVDVGPARDAAEKLADLWLYRVWHDKSGAFSVAAKFLRYRSGTVELQILNSKAKGVPFKRLSEADQAYVEEAVRKAKAEKKTAKAK